MSDTALLRIGILAAGLLLIAAIFLFGRPKKSPRGAAWKARSRPAASAVSRCWATMASSGRWPRRAGHGRGGSRPSLAWPTPTRPRPATGKRTTQDFDKIVSLFVAARAGEQLRGEDIVVAAEKTGLVFGHMNVFHRLVEGHPERGPIFSMASIMKPGSFDMANIRAMETPAIAFFLTLPAPLTALDAWEKMLPPCSAWPSCSMAWCWTTAAMPWGASASHTSVTSCAPTIASTRHRR